MVMFLLQSALLLAIAFLLGCVVGCLLHRYLAASAATVPAAGDKKIDEAPAKLESSAEPALKPAAEPAMTCATGACGRAAAGRYCYRQG